MKKFLELLLTHEYEIDIEILDMIESFSDFDTFKGLMLDFKVYLSQEENLSQLFLKGNKIM